MASVCDVSVARTRGRATDYAALLESVNGIVWEADPKTFRFEFVSRQAERLLGYPAERWIEDPDFWVDHLHPDDRHRVVTLCRQATAEGRAHEFEYRMIAADGRVVWLHDIVNVIVADGCPIRCRGVMIDISQRKATEAQLHLSNERLRAVVANAPVILFALDREGVIRLCEGRDLPVLRLDTARIIGHRFDEPGIMPAWLVGNLERAFAGEEFSDHGEFRGRAFDTYYAALRDEEGRPAGVIGVGTDVTDRLQAERERQRLEEQVQHAQKLESLGALAGGIAHDFNNLLVTVLASADLLLADLGPTAQQRPSLERICRAARAASNLTHQLLAYSGRARFETQPLDLSALVRTLLELLRSSISEQAELRCELVDHLPAIDGDPAQIHQVLSNLIVNASEALADEPGSIAVRTGTLKVTSDELCQSYLHDGLVEGPYVFLEVSDTGSGMEPGAHSRIFDPFYTTKFTGRGLGLATVLGIVRAHRGTVGVYSEPGRGSRFRVIFPATGAAIRAPDRGGWRGEGTLLVVDDEPDVRELVGEMLQRLGFEVMTARSGGDAVRVFADHADEIRGVLVDMTMPEMDGRTAALRLREARPDLPVLLMSGFSEEYAAAQAADDLVAGFVQKPFDREQLADALRAVLGAST